MITSAVFDSCNLLNIRRKAVEKMIGNEGDMLSIMHLILYVERQIKASKYKYLCYPLKDYELFKG